MKHLFLIMLVFLLFSSGLCEGVRELRPDSTYSSADLTVDNGISGLNYYPPFARINCPPNYRLYIHIKNPGEKILFGLKCNTTYRQYNLRKPNGTVAMTGTCPYSSSQTGYILPCTWWV
jgi:hypothetical protein